MTRTRASGEAKRWPLLVLMGAKVSSASSLSVGVLLADVVVEAAREV